MPSFYSSLSSDLADEISVGDETFGVNHPLGGVPVDLEVHGEIDVSVASPLLGALTVAIDNCTTRRVTVDFSRVLFIDSSGLGALVAARNHAKTLSRELVLVAPMPRVKAVLELSGLNRCFSVVQVLPQKS